MLQVYRGRILHCLDDPGDDPGSVAAQVEYLEDGLLLVRDGKIERTLPAAHGLEALEGEYVVTDYSGCWIVPGFVDCHVHYPQLEVIGSYGEKLLDWLETYTYPAERRFADRQHAEEAAHFFVDQLIANGTTTALVFATVHAVSAEAIFKAAAARDMRLIAGKVLMDRNCPPDLCDTAASGAQQSHELIERWHGHQRLQYAITPRFAPTSTPAQLQAAGELAQQYPDVYVHSHLAETTAEVDWVASLFAQHDSYLGVYDHYGLVRERSVYAHCLHLDDSDVAQMAGQGAAMAFCPSSNLFLGSGLFDLERARAHEARVGLGTDVGGGTSLSLLQTIDNAYKVTHLAGQSLSPWQAFYRVTLGGAKALYLDDKIGNFAAGKESDFVVIDPGRRELVKRRSAAAQDLWEELFALMILGDDRLIRATYVNGEQAYEG